MNSLKYFLFFIVGFIGIVGLPPAFASTNVDIFYQPTPNTVTLTTNFEDIAGTVCLAESRIDVYNTQYLNERYIPTKFNYENYQNIVYDRYDKKYTEIDCSGTLTIDIPKMIFYMNDPQNENFSINTLFYRISVDDKGSFFSFSPLERSVTHYFPATQKTDAKMKEECTDNVGWINTHSWITVNKSIKFLDERCIQEPLTEYRIPTVTEELTDDTNDNGGEGCNDCLPPTLGIDKYGIQLVENGFSYNGNTVDVKYYHTNLPLIITKIGQENIVETIIYENSGIHNIKWVQMGLGLEKVGTPINNAEVIIQLILSNSEIDEIILSDESNLIENVTATATPHACYVTSPLEECLKVNFIYTYRESPKYNIIAINLMDTKRNSITHYFNDGIIVTGESLNPAATDKIFVKYTNEGKQIWLHLTQTDKVNNIWTDQNEIQYQKTKYDSYDRIY